MTTYHFVLRASCLILFANTCLSQDSVRISPRSSGAALGVTIGINQLKDENLLPRVHGGFITSFSYSHRNVGRTYADFSLSLSYSRISATGEEITKSVNGMVAASYGYAFSVASTDRMSCFIGPQAQTTYSVSFYPNWDDSHLYWANILSLGVTNVFLFTFDDKTALVAAFDFPVLSLRSRPDALRLYKFDDASFAGLMNNLHHDLRVGFPGSDLIVHFGVEYQFPVFQEKTEAVFCTFNYTKIVTANASSFKQLQYQLGLRMFL